MLSVFILDFQIPSANGERQILPKQTMSIFVFISERVKIQLIIKQL